MGAAQPLVHAAVRGMRPDFTQLIFVAILETVTQTWLQGAVEDSGTGEHTMENRYKSFLRKLTSIAACLAVSGMLAFPGQFALAQTDQADETDGTVIEEMIVTAQKREQRLMDVPISFQAFDGQDLETRGLGDLTRFINEIPGASTNLSWSPSITQVQLRGTGVTGAQGSAVVGFYVDEVPFIIPNAQLAPISNMYDLERVEVLRGPQGTLWGLGSMGGTIRYITPDPDTSRFGAKLRATLSDMDDGDTGYTVDGMLNIPVAEDVFAIRLTGGIDDFSGFSESPDFPDEENINGGDTSHARVKALWNASDDVRLTASYWHIETDQGFNNVVESLEPPLVASSGGFRGFSDGDSDQFNVTLDWTLGFADLVATSTWLDYIGSFGLGFGAPPFNGDLVSTTDAESFAQEIRLVSNSDGPHEWIVGVFYNDATASFATDLSFEQAFLQLLAGSDSVLEIDSESIAVFGEMSYELMDGKLVPLIGLRYFEDDRDFTETAVLFTGTPNETPPTVESDSASFDSWNPRFNLSYYPNNDTTLYFNAAKGFRSGSQQTAIQVLAAQLDGLNAEQAIKDDSVWSYELGGKFSLADNRMTVELAAYLSEFNDVQVQYTSSLGIISTITGGDSEVLGLEAAMNWLTPVEGLSLQLNFSVLDTEWTNVDGAVGTAVSGITEGESVPFTPEWSYLIAAELVRPVGGFMGYGYVGYSKRDSQFDFGLIESAKVEDLSARAGLQADKWEAYLFADNITDDRGPILVSPGITSNYSNFPRRMGVTLQLRF